MKCTQQGCTAPVVCSIVWPGQGRLTYCERHRSKVYRVAESLGLSAKSLDEVIARSCIAVGRDPRCDEPATVVCTDATDLQWYACDKHTEGAVQTMPLIDWFARLFEHWPKS